MRSRGRASSGDQEGMTRDVGKTKSVESWKPHEIISKGQSEELRSVCRWARRGDDRELPLGSELCMSWVALVKIVQCHVTLVALAAEALVVWVWREGWRGGIGWRWRLSTTV